MRSLPLYPILLVAVFGSRDALAQGYSATSGRIYEFVHSGVPKSITLQVTPTSTCRPSTSTDPIPNYPDERGVLGFDVEVPGPVGTKVQIDLTCEDQGIVTPFSVFVEVVAAPLLAGPTISDKAGRPLRPALVGNPDTLTQDELHRQGYRSRPDATKDPVAYARWKQELSVPMAIVNGPVHETPLRANVDTVNWSGTESSPGTTGNFVPYWDVTGTWVVPQVSSQCFFSGEYLKSLLWVGMGGDGNWEVNPPNQLFQAGTLQQVWTSAPGLGCYYLQTYSTWYEIAPQIGVTYTSVGVTYGDTVYVEVESGNANGLAFPADSAWFFIQNQTRGTMIPWTRVALTGSNAYAGTTAEWIMERPALAGNPITLRDLPNYGQAQVSAGWAYQTNWASWTASTAQGLNMQSCLPGLTGAWRNYSCSAPGAQPQHLVSSVLWVDPTGNIVDYIWNAAF
jgi:hypothetical protein